MSTTIVEIRVDKIPPYIQGLLGCWKSDYIKAYILIPEKWVKIEGYEVMLTHKRSTKVFVKYPPTTKVSRIKNLFWFLQKGLQVDGFCKIPSDKIDILVWKDGETFMAFFVGLLTKMG
jgi:hypothetical protein